MDTVQKIIKLSDIESYTSKIGLEISGSFYPNPNQTIILLSPADNFWDIFKKSEEYTQKVKDPIDNAFYSPVILPKIIRADALSGSI